MLRRSLILRRSRLPVRERYQPSPATRTQVLHRLFSLLIFRVFSLSSPDHSAYEALIPQ